ncbi:hypothetical protein [Streptomyces rochei]|uniref:hypothetical protein n=1 Tax=Streptomyces rochei TaxID=1928 RepID=UPI00368362A7
MSSGVALPTLDLVAPSVAFSQPLPAADVYAVPHTGAAQLGDAASEASTQMSEAVAHGLREAGEAAVEVLGALSGALLAGRAAMLTTRVLASAAVRAAEEQRCLERQEELSAAAAEQWQAAAYAVARANARRTALLARCARDAGAPGDGGGPSRPDLPPPLDPVGRPLGEVRAELARLEEALRRAEERRTAWEVARLTAVLDGAAEGDDTWRRLVADRREAMVRRHTASRTAEAERDEAGPGEPPRPTADATADPEAVRALGADILAALDPAAASATVELAVGAVGRAVGRAALDPARARRHLVEARKFVQDANRTARRRRADEEWAAAQLDFLTRRAPEDTEALDEAPDAVGPLRRLLAEGVPLSPGERRTVELRVSERMAHLEALYVQAQCAHALSELAERFGGPADASRPEGQDLRLDWTPDGWGPDHWLRATLVGGTLRFATMYRGGPGERGRRERALDDARCAEAQERLAEFTAVARELGLTVDLRIEQTEGARPGLPGEHGAVVLDPVRGTFGGQPPQGKPDREQSVPRYRTVGDERR